MVKYERIRFDNKTVILRDSHEVEFMGTKCLSGIEVNNEGEEVASRGVDERKHIIELSLITKRTSLVMNNHYGILEQSKS